jgi:aldehyde:ferredoxin oxidoreductase
MFGYHGKFLDVNLSTGEIKDLLLNEEQVKNFIGGAGLSARLIYSHVKGGMDPLGADNPLVFAVGPFVGTTIPMVSRSSVCGVSPQTGFWGEATTGGVFPFRLKASGFDGIFITGKSNKPVYLYVNDGNAEIRNASHLWGKDSYETQKMLKNEIKQRGLSVSCIGAGGENLVKYAGVMNDDGRAAGRCGLGTLMGSKKLKAVAVTGNKKAEVSDETNIRRLTKEARDLIRARRASMMEYGTLGYMETGFVIGDTPANYFTTSVFPVRKVSGLAFRQAYTIESTACYGCPMGCGRLLRHFSKDIDMVDGPEYETAAVFGPLCRNYDLDSIVYANHLCNLHGIDTISAGVTIAYAMHLYEKGILDSKKAGMKIEWGDGKAIVKLVEMIVSRQGIGDLLAEGSLKVGQELDADLEEVAHVKGLEIPMHDARSTTGLAISYATGSRGACHLRGDYYQVDMGVRVPEFGVEPGDRFKSQGKAEMAAKFQNFKDLFDSVLMCKFAPLSLTQISGVLNSITGWNFSPGDMGIIAERSINIKRAISNKLGLTREDDKMPRISIHALKEGSTAGKSPDMGTLLKEYYDYRQWDLDTGKPKKERLIELGLDNVANDLWP